MTAVAESVVIAADRILASMHADKAIGDVASGLLPGLLFEVWIERFDTARKCRPVMLIAERLDCPG